ncbi:MAG TPA: RHS repeat-associated core domain-containing protein [Ktedonobacteraceae bacterium]
MKHLNETTCVANPWQYAGGYLESSAGPVKFGTRHYNPALGRWTQQDPVADSLGNPDSLNWYLYAQDEPVNAVDPSRRFDIRRAGAFLFFSFAIGFLYKGFEKNRFLKCFEAINSTASIRT